MAKMPPLPPYFRADGDALHLNVPMFLQMHGYQDTAENREMVCEIVREIVAEKWPQTRVVVAR